MSTQKRLIDRLTTARGWSTRTRFPYEIKDAEGQLIQKVWIKPLSRAETKTLAEGDPSDISFKMLVKAVFLSETGSDRAFEMAEIPQLKKEISSALLNDLELALLNAGKPAPGDLEQEKKG